jgi:uncharacterized membrane protein
MGSRRPQALDLIDPDDVNRAADAAARARAERRRERQERRSARRFSRVPRAGAYADRWSRILAALVAALLIATVVGLVVLWPGSGRPAHESQAFGGPTVGATVTGEREVRCPGPAGQRCRQLEARVDGRPIRLTLGPEDFTAPVKRGARVRVRRIVPEASIGASDGEPYAFVAVDHRSALLWLALAFAALVVVLTRWRGVLALVGFAVSLLLVTRFVVPAILAGSPALPVALVGSLAVMFVTVGLTYGVSPQSMAAALGIAASLGFATAVGTIAIHAAGLDGRSGEFAIALTQTAQGVSLQGIVLAGVVIGALGVLADMGVTQASAVMALRRANPELSAVGLYRGAFAVGRDHLVATTHTLVLAYVGATLPLLLVLHAAAVAVPDALNAPDIAEPIVATLVGAMALLVSVPLTTALAAALVHRMPSEAIPAGAGHHAH